MAITIQEVRQKYPEYKDLSDKQLADSLHQKFYSDIPLNNFYNQIGLSTSQTAQPEDLSALDVAKDVGVSAARGITKGIAGTLALPSMAEQGIDYLMRKILNEYAANVLEEFRQKNPPILGMPGLLTRTPTFQDIMGLVPEGLREYDPQTTAGGYAETIAEFTALAVFLLERQKLLDK